MTLPVFKTYAEFWPFYLQAHSKPATKWLHVLSLISGIAYAIYCLMSANYWWVLGTPVIGYGFA